MEEVCVYNYIYTWVDGASVLGFASGPQIVKNGPIRDTQQTRTGTSKPTYTYIRTLNHTR
jgi:hypothetical protein